MFQNSNKLSTFRRVDRRTVTQGSENRVVQRSPESGLAGASVPSGPVVAVGIGMAAVAIGSLCRTFVQIQFAVVADKSQPAFTLIGRHALAAVLARLVAHSCHEKKTNFHSNFRHKRIRQRGVPNAPHWNTSPTGGTWCGLTS